MNTEEREMFWNKLSSFDGDDVDAEISMLKKIIKYPKYLYRFRSISSNTLDGLRANKLYFSSADKYDDPFDSFIHIDWEKVEKEISKELQCMEAKNKAIDILRPQIDISYEVMSKLTNCYNIDKWTEIGKIIIKNTRLEIQKENLSICFSEDKLNEVWRVSKQPKSG